MQVTFKTWYSKLFTFPHVPNSEHTELHVHKYNKKREILNSNILKLIQLLPVSLKQKYLLNLEGLYLHLTHTPNKDT